MLRCHNRNYITCIYRCAIIFHVVCMLSMVYIYIFVIVRFSFYFIILLLLLCNELRHDLINGICIFSQYIRLLMEWMYSTRSCMSTIQQYVLFYVNYYCGVEFFGAQLIYYCLLQSEYCLYFSFILFFIICFFRLFTSQIIYYFVCFRRLSPATIDRQQSHRCLFILFVNLEMLVDDIGRWFYFCFLIGI